MSISPSASTPFIISTVCQEIRPIQKKNFCQHNCLIRFSDGNYCQVSLLDADSIRSLINKRGLDSFRAVDRFSVELNKQTTKNWMNMHFNTDICFTYRKEEDAKIATLKNAYLLSRGKNP